MNLVMINHSSERMPRKYLSRHIQKIVRLLRSRHKAVANKDLIIVFVDKKKMRQMNMQYRGKDYATDVLSFEPAEKTSLGELIICPQIVKEQSKATGLAPQQELGYMVLHGVLHLLGYDHEKNERGARKMFELQDRIFAETLKSSSR